jgi:hypothetical protein
MRTSTLFCCLCLSLLAGSAGARIASVSLEELIAGSDSIVVATVSVVEEPTPERQLVYATAVVQRTIKGSLNGVFRFLSKSDFVCDTSEGVPGETALFFLYRASDGNYGIAAAGRGRMPLRIVDGKTYVTAWTDDVRIPKDVPTVDGPDPRYSFIRSVELEHLEAQIRKNLSAR